MSIKNKKGFTMVEILAAVTILGILSIIAITAVNNVIQKSKQNHYTTAEKELSLAGQSYVQQNRSKLPKAIGQKKQIYLKELVEKNYIETIKDYNGKNCDVEESYVQIFKYSQSDYSYLPYLKCDQYDGEESFTQGSPEITLTITDGNRLKIAQAKIKITDQEKLLSWSYIVYRDGKEVLNSGNLMATDYPKLIEKKLDIAKYTPGKVKVVVTATNIYGQTSTKSVQRDYNDIEKPVCVYLNSGDDPASSEKKVWTTDTRTITVGCNDGDGVGCAREEFTKTFNGSTNVGYITIKDKKGNTAECPVTVMIDKKSPTIIVKAYKRKSDGTKEATTFATKTLTGIQQSPLTTDFDLSEKVTTGWFNNTDYPYGVYLEVSISDDVEVSKYQSKINNANQKTSTTEDENLVNIIENKTDIGKTSDTYNISVSDDGYRTLAVIATDLAGNVSRVNVTLPLDRVAPTKPTVGLYKWSNNSTQPSSESGLSTYTADTWSSKNVYTKASGSTDSMSGFSKYIYTTTGATEAATKKEGQTRNIKAEGESTIKYAACDVAGNCSAFSTAYKVKIDKTNPTCTSSGGKSAWTNEDITLTGTCSEASLGCSSVTKKYTNNTNSTTESPGSVTDRAGNTVTCPANQTVKIDKTAPSAPTTGTISVSGSSTTGNIPTVSGSTDTGGSGLKEYRYYVANSTGTYANTDSKFTTTKTFTRACGRSYYLYAVAVDNAGNISPVAYLSSTSDGANIYSDWSGCSKNCDGGTRTRTNSCLLITTGLSEACNEQACCSASSVVYTETTTCSKVCGGGTYLRNAYSSYDNSIACPSFDDYGGGSCNTGDCCYSTETTWGDWGICSAECGGGTRTRTGSKYSTIDGSYCGEAEESEACNEDACAPDYGINNCNIRGSTKRTFSHSWNCSCGKSHTTGYTHYCTDGNGVLHDRDSNSSLVTFRWVCPISPYGEAQGWIVISD